MPLQMNIQTMLEFELLLANFTLKRHFGRMHPTNVTGEIIENAEFLTTEVADEFLHCIFIESVSVLVQLHLELIEKGFVAFIALVRSIVSMPQKVCDDFFTVSTNLVTH